MAKVGGKRAGAGRPKGAVAKSTAEIKALAQVYGEKGVARLAVLAGLIEGHDGADSQVTQVMAIKELFDRAYGKSAQPQTGEGGEGNPVVEVIYRWEK
jgi:hypothetical protein